MLAMFDTIEEDQADCLAIQGEVEAKFASLNRTHQVGRPRAARLPPVAPTRRLRSPFADGAAAARRRRGPHRGLDRGHAA